MNKALAVGFAVMMATGALVAQPETTAPATASNQAVTTATASNQAETTNPAARLFTQEQFEKRWATEARIYKEAGISEEKIQKLHDLNSQIWSARQSGQAGDFQQIMKQRAEILSQEEVEKIRDLRRKEIEKQLGSRTGSTTVTRGLSNNTTATESNSN